MDIAQTFGYRLPTAAIYEFVWGSSSSKFSQCELESCATGAVDVGDRQVNQKRQGYEKTREREYVEPAMNRVSFEVGLKGNHRVLVYGVSTLL